MEEINVIQFPDEVGSHRVRQRHVPAPKRLQEVAQRANGPVTSSGQSSEVSTVAQNDKAVLTRGQRHEMQIRAAIGALVLSLLTLALAAFLLGLFHHGEWPAQPNARPIDDNHISALQTLTQLQDQGSPYVIVFYSTKCMGCRHMRAPFLRASTLLEHVAPCFTAEISHKSTRKLARQLNVTSVPSIYVVRGQTHDVYSGKRDPDAIFKFVNDSLATTHIGEETSHQQASDDKQTTRKE